MSFSEQWNLSYPIDNDVIGTDSLCVRGRTTSGAGQFELAGSCSTSNGGFVRARDIVDHFVRFEIPAHDGRSSIKLSEQYPIREVGGKVRINLQDASGARPNIGNLFAALLLLPEVSQIGKAVASEADGFTDKSYWIDAAEVSVDNSTKDVVTLSLVKLILATGNKDDGAQPSGAMEFDFQKRLAELLAVCELGKSAEAGGVPAALKYYADVLTGKAEFDYSVGLVMRNIISDHLAHSDAVEKQAGNDPLVALRKLLSTAPDRVLNLKTISEPQNLIYFGAPGTGKSHNLSKLAKANFSDSHIRRVTFYPDYTYSQFVGCFKPMTVKTKGEDGKTTSEISYRYVLGPFLETYVNSVKNPEQNYLLIVEEINRANPAAVFGDVFQLLDRDKDGASAYDVDAPAEMRDRLADELGAEVDKLKIPANMFIWATMNSADQGVFPMDTAFKRRWSFRYIGIDDGEDAEIDGEKLSDKVVICGGRRVYWNRLRKAINDLMAHDCDINEDKLLGPFFLDPACLNDEQFADAFKDKVLMYLYEDAGKARRKTLFREKGITYSQLCSAFDREGELVFGGNFDDWGILADQEYEIDDEQSTE